MTHHMNATNNYLLRSNSHIHITTLHLSVWRCEHNNKRGTMKHCNTNTFGQAEKSSKRNHSLISDGSIVSCRQGERRKCSDSVTQLCAHGRFHSPHIEIINLHCAKNRAHVDAYMALYDARIHKGIEHQGSIILSGNQFRIRHTQNHVLREQSAYCKHLN
jgi:hypothetical protein